MVNLKVIDMYKPGMGFAYATSLVVFFMYMMLQLIDLNNFVQSMEVTEVEKATRSTLVFAYMVGYFVFFFKLLLNLITLVFLVTIIIWIILGMTQMLVGQEGGGGMHGGGPQSAAELRGGSMQDLGKNMAKAAKNVGAHFMGIIFVDNFYFIFTFIIPIFLLFFLIMFVQFYKRDIILENNQDQKTNIALTNHNFMMLMITTLATFGILKISIDYMYKLIKAKPADGEGEGEAAE